MIWYIYALCNLVDDLVYMYYRPIIIFYKLPCSHTRICTITGSCVTRDFSPEGLLLVFGRWRWPLFTMAQCLANKRCPKKRLRASITPDLIQSDLCNCTAYFRRVSREPPDRHLTPLFGPAPSIVSSDHAPRQATNSGLTPLSDWLPPNNPTRVLLPPSNVRY